MQFRHKDNQQRGTMDLGGNLRVDIQSDGTFTVPEGTPKATIERLKAVGHQPIHPNQAASHVVEEQTATTQKPAVAQQPKDELDNLDRRALYRLAQENGLPVKWAGPGSDTAEDLRRKLREG